MASTSKADSRSLLAVSSPSAGEERRRAGLEPPRVEPAAVEQQQNVVRVVDPLLAEPAVAVVPLADAVPVQPRQLRREHGIEVGVGVAADARVARVQGDVLEVVEPGEETDLRELAHTSEESKANVCVARLDCGIQAAQIVAVGPGHLRGLERIEDRLVVLVHQHHDWVPGLPLQRADQMTETDRRGVVAGRDTGHLRGILQLRHHVLVKPPRFLVAPGAEVQSQDWMAHGPVPVVANLQPLEQRLVSLEQLLDRVQEQALAEAPRARQEIVLPFDHQPSQIGGLVDVVALCFPDLPESLHADRQSASGHERALLTNRTRAPAVTRARTGLKACSSMA